MPRHSRPRLASLALALIATCWLPGHVIAQSAVPLKVRNSDHQLQGAVPAEIAASPFDLVVIDYSHNGTEKVPIPRMMFKRCGAKPMAGGASFCPT